MLSQDSYLRYNNDYWTRDRWKDVGRNALALLLGAVIGFEGYTIAKKESPFVTAPKLSKRAAYGVDQMTDAFPLKIMAYAKFALSKKNKLEPQELSDFLDDKAVKIDLFNQFKYDKKIKYSEIGGVVVMYKIGGQEHLQFIQIESDNMKLSRQILDCLDDKEALLKIYERDKNRFKELYRGGLAEIVDGHIYKGTKDDWFLSNTMKFYTDLSDSRYELGDEERLKIFYPGNMPGKIIATYHIHDNGEEPSDFDFNGSKNFREFVVAATKRGFTLYDLLDGKINSEHKKSW